MARLIGIIVIVAALAGVGNMALQAGQDIAYAYNACQDIADAYKTYNAKIEEVLNGF